MTSATEALPATDRRSRRRGYREVSSRYMNTLVSTDSDSLSSFADENQQINAINTQRRCVIRQFNDNDNNNNGDQHRPLDVKLQPRKPSRPATPMDGGTSRPLLTSQKPLRPGNPGLVPTTMVRRSVPAGSGMQEGKDNSPGRLSRSLNSSLPKCPQLHIKPLSRPPPLWRRPVREVKDYGAGQNSVMGIEQRKGRKGLDRPEDVHPLEVLHNTLLQWRFTNAKALAVDRARTSTAVKLLYEASSKISKLRDSVALKRIQLEQLKREQNLITITEAQMPHLHEWAILEEDYSGAINALQDASNRLPVTSNVKADIGELKEALDPATHMLEALSVNAGKFMSQVEGLEVVSADLARVVSTEIALVEECGDLLSLAHILQVKECNLRTQLMQLKCIESERRKSS